MSSRTVQIANWRKLLIGSEHYNATFDQSDPLLTQDQSYNFVRDVLGLPAPSKSYWNKLCLPSRGDGPPVETYWGARPLRRQSKVRDWALSRFSNKRGTLAA